MIASAIDEQIRHVNRHARPQPSIVSITAPEIGSESRRPNGGLDCDRILRRRCPFVSVDQIWLISPKSCLILIGGIALRGGICLYPLRIEIIRQGIGCNIEQPGLINIHNVNLRVSVPA